MTSPSAKIPSIGIMLPVRITILSPGRISDTAVRISDSGVFSHTRSTFRAIQRARSSIDFFLVHSSNSSPSSSRNMTVPAVPKSLRNTEIPMDNASSTSTFSFPLQRQWIPLFKKGSICHTIRAICNGFGKKSIDAAFSTTFPTSFS